METRHRKTTTFLFMLVISFGGLVKSASPASAQGICVPEPLVVAAVAGKVVAQLERGETPLSHASIALFKDQYKEYLVAKTTADTNGYFSLDRIEPGKYILFVTVPNLKPFSVRVRVEASNAATSKQEIIVTIGAEVTRPCAGSKAEVRTKDNLTSTLPSSHVRKIRLSFDERACLWNKGAGHGSMSQRVKQAIETYDKAHP